MVLTIKKKSKNKKRADDILSGQEVKSIKWQSDAGHGAFALFETKKYCCHSNFVVYLVQRACKT